MKKQILLAACLGIFAGCQESPKAGPTTAPALTTSAKVTGSKEVGKFGPDQKLTDADNVPVEKVLADPDQYSGKYVRITGIVSAVCPAKGCWLRVVPEPGSGHGDVFVKFMDPPEGRLIPMEAVGHDVTVEGTIKNGSISEAQAKHLKLDAGASQEEIDKITGPQKQVMIATPAVTIEGVKNPQQN